MPQVACRQRLVVICAQLLDENLVTAEQVPRCRAILPDVSTIDPRTLLFRMDHQFRVSFSKPLQYGSPLLVRHDTP
ncbi:hypothetical protein DFH08DRAFT_886153 [Mycena albidolilacea]|uniref:Uncharacterized protein n=1 Tax=Mycena albidolilacea TaxID=1033008 RepID=A0AAD6ZJ92_9AGAR|nr:hypothetical protein DFH08DRAFT_886153 [Mycena albidolilacea]